MRRRRKRLRIDRIVYCLVFLCVFIFFIIFGIYSLINLHIYNSAKDKGIINLHKSEVKVWKKTVNYIKDNNKEIVVNHRKSSLTFKNGSFVNGASLDLNIYNKNIDEALFDNVRTLYIEKNDTLKNLSKLKVKLPRYLYKNEVVDVYGVKNKDIIKLQSALKVDNKYVTFNINDNYDDYFITYIKVKSISSSNNVKMDIDEVRDLNIRVNPSNATITTLSYKYNKKKISLKGDVVTAIKSGKVTINVTSKKDNVSKEINLTISKKQKEKKKEEVMEEKKNKNEVTNVDGITYVDGIMIVNKTYSLPSSYNPGGLKDEFMDAFYEMQSAAALDNINLFVASGFRDYEYQADLYDDYVKRDGKEAADTYSARPGHSEHQTGLAADINAADSSFEDTPEAIWLDKNCYDYGFVVRFPKGKEAYTGYKYEPWHLRYVGKEIAKKIKDAGKVSLEEYYNLTSKYSD